MRLSTKCMYAIRALFDIAYHGNGEPVAGKDIAEREEIPHRFLEQILLDLKRAGLVRSKRGPRGGYMLDKDAPDIDMLTVVEVIDGPLEHSFCYATDEEARRKCQIKGRCVTAAFWRDIAVALKAKLRNFSLQDMVERGEALGVCKDGDDAIFYVI